MSPYVRVKTYCMLLLSNVTFLFLKNCISMWSSHFLNLIVYHCGLFNHIHHRLRPKKLYMVWRWHQPGPFPTAACPEIHFGCRLCRELFTLSVCCRCPWIHRVRPRKLYHTRIVAMTSAPVRVSTQRPLVLSFT